MQDIEKIYKEYFETVHKYLFCLTSNNDISEELTQETFCKAVKRQAHIKVNVKYLYGCVKQLKTCGLINVEKTKG